MTRIEYLKLALKNRLYMNKAWVIKAFSITKDKSTVLPYDIMRKEWGYTFTDSEGNVKDIDSTDPTKPLFTFNEKITIDNSWCMSIAKEEVIESTIGNLFFNILCLVEAFGHKFPYVEGRVNPNVIDNSIASRLESTPLTIGGDIDKAASRDPDKLYTDEYVVYVNMLQYMATFTQLATVTATIKTIVKPVGIDKFKKELLKKYGKTLSDPVELNKFEQELKNFDDNYLKNDPSYGKFMSGKVQNVARKKMFLSVGSEDSFKDTLETNPVNNSLDEGWSTKPEDIVAMNNASRIGSFSRGSETVKGGVAAKVLLRSTAAFSITTKDCGTKVGITKKYTEEHIGRLVGRYIIVKGKSILIENIQQATNYVGKEVSVRSPMYCLVKSTHLCEVCSGTNLSRFKEGLTIPVSEISSIILTASLKKMHGTILSTVNVDLEETVS